MSRLSREIVDGALVVISTALDELRDALDEMGGMADVSAEHAALEVIRQAVEPRPVWPAKEVAAELGIDPANIDGVKGLPAPVQVLPRPSVTHPDKVMRLWDQREIVAFAPEYKARRRGAEKGS